MRIKIRSGQLYQTILTPDRKLCKFLLNRLTLELAQIEIVIETFLLQKLEVIALFDDFSLVDHNYVFSVTDRAEVGGDDKASPPIHQFEQRFEILFLLSYE